MPRASDLQVESFDGSDQFTLQGAARRVIWLISQVLGRGRWAGLIHHRAASASLTRRRPVFGAR